jgi:AraC-like DNA-binding protein/quercetin dioxygenase-like cupin family protein
MEELMKAIRENILYTTESFSVSLFEGDNFDHPYHFHFENEIVIIYKSQGTILLGDQVAEYNEGDIFILGSNVPHVFISAPDLKCAKSMVIQFNDNCFGESFFRLPEFRSISQMLKKSKFGLRIRDNRAGITSMIENTCFSTGVNSIINFISLLYAISQSNNTELILPNNDNSLEMHKLNAAIDWINANYFRTVQLADIAMITNLTEHAFCRSFKKATGKTFLQYLNDIRVHEAAKQLIENELSITQIAYKVGFSNISSFNRYFRKVKNLSPSEFRKNIGNYVTG